MLRRIAFMVIFVSAGFLAGLVLTGRLRSANDSLANPNVPAVSATEPSPQAATSTPTLPGLPDFSGIAARAVGGVVNISSVTLVRQPVFSDPFFDQFFGGGEGFGSRFSPQQSLGSGVVISDDGYVVTNAHVVSGNVREINVVLNDKRTVPGEIVGRDEMTDIAVIRLKARGLTPVPWGDSTKLKVGQWVLAIGSPFQLNQTVTLGIISAIGRTGVGVTAYEDFIQTDAAINPGNSGGPLIDARGDVIGINTAIATESRGYQGVGFAVPSNLARRIADDLIKYGSVQRGSIGALRIVKLTPELAEEIGLPGTKGILVYEVGRTAYDAGLRRGDIIQTFNGQSPEDESHLIRLLADSKPGTTASITVLRDGRRTELKVPVTNQSRTRGRG
jgi:Do/DeqQ family serine protease